MYEKRSEGRVSAIAEASALVRQIASPAQVGDTIKRQIGRASRRIPFWSTSRVKDVWYADSRIRVGADELAELRAIAGADEHARTAQREYAQLLDRIARLEAALGLQDEEFHRPTLDALDRMAGVQNRSLGK